MKVEEEMSDTTLLQLVPGFNNGIIDRFGNGTANGAHTGFYQTPNSLSGTVASGWYVTQWGQPVTVDPSAYTVDNPSTYDDLYGNALYSWVTPGATAGMQIYQNKISLGGGYVIQLDDGSTTSPTPIEDDMNISAPDIPIANASLANTITISVHEKILQAINTFVNTTTGAPISGAQMIESNVGIGFTINFNGTDGIGARAGFVQIQSWNSLKAGNVYYNSLSNNMFISTLLVDNDSYLPLLPSDANATSDTLTYNLNKYVYKTIYTVYANSSSLTAEQKAAILNLSNWTVGSMYLGPATTNIQTMTSTVDNNTVQANAVVSQISDISVVSNPSNIYNPASASESTPIIDTNPKIDFIDTTPFGTVTPQSGEADGGAYTGTNAAGLVIDNIQDEYIYTGYDNIELTALVGANWYFGGGHGQTTLTATSGANIFLASYAGSTMNSGSGNDNFIVPLATIGFSTVTDTLNNFHQGDVLTLISAGESGWTYSWTPIYGSLGSNFTKIVNMEMTATNGAGLTENVILDGMTLNDLYHLSLQVNPDTSNLTITSTNAGLGPVIMVQDSSSNQVGYLLGTPSGIQDQFGQVTEANWIEATAPTNIQANYIYSGGDNITVTATPGENWRFGGGTGSDRLIATGGNNEFVSSSGSSWMDGGDGKDTFYIPDANKTGKTAWDTITNFHNGDVLNLSGLAGSGWTYSWFDGLGASGYTGATLYATSTENSNLHVVLSLAGLSLGDIAGMSVTSNVSSGTLTINDTEGNDPPYILGIDPATNDSVIEAAQSSVIPNIGNLFIYSGSKPMMFLAPSDEGNWEFGGGLAETALSATTGDNILVASLGGSFMAGGSGNNQFQISNATITGKTFWDSITDMHAGDSVILAGMSTSDWSFGFAKLNMGTAGFQGLTFEAENKTNAGLSELLTFTNLQSSQSSLLSVSQGTGSQMGSLIITMH
jgi:hypothetical protein